MATKTTFKTAYGEREAWATPSGEMVLPTYEHKINEYGEKHLEQTGEKNIYAEIQTYLEESKIENAINRVIAGDVSALRPDGNYIDCTTMPKNLMEAQQIIQDMSNIWQKLPIELRSKYNHSVEEFVAASGSKKWLEDMGLAPEVEPIKTEPIQKAKKTTVEKGQPANTPAEGGIDA